MTDPLADAKRRARRKYIAMLRRQRRYAISYFVVWPPPHLKFRRREDRACWFWNDRNRTWGKKEEGTGYPTREEAEAVAVAAVAATAEAVGHVRTSRQLVKLVRVDMSEV